MVFMHEKGMERETSVPVVSRSGQPVNLCSLERMPMENDLRILLVEDLPSDAELIEREIRTAGYIPAIHRVETRQDFVGSLLEYAPDVIVSDCLLSEFTGREALALAGEHAPSTPFIMVTGALSEETAVEYMKAGAWDYVAKERLVRLGPSIHAALEKKRLLDEKKQAEEALAKTRNFYLNLLEVSPALIWRASPEGVLDFFNTNWLSFTGRTLQQQIGDGWTESIHPDDVEGLRMHMRDYVSSRVSFEIEYRLRRHDGHYRWIQNFGRPFHDDRGAFAGHIGYCFDKTERYETDEVLRKLSRAVEQSKTAIVITDTEGRIEYANPSYTEMTGFRLEEIIGRNPRNDQGVGALPDIFGDFWQTVQKGGEWRGELRNRKENGEQYWEFTTVSPVTNADDIITHYLVEKEDITLRKKTEKALEESRAELFRKHGELQQLFEQVARSKEEWEKTLDCIGDIVILVDSQGRIKRCNRALQEFASLSYHQILGNHVMEFLCFHGLLFPDDVSLGSEVLHQGSRRWFFCKSYPFIDDESPETAGFVLSIHDTTEQKRVSEELEKAYRELKATQAALVHQEKMASIGQLAAGVAHEINNPMGFVSSNLGTLGKYQAKLEEFARILTKIVESTGNEDALRILGESRKALKIDYVMEDGNELIKESLEGAERVRTIVQNLKSFSRVDESEYKLADINECLESTINILSNEVKYKANLVRDLGDIPMTRCYPQQINQLFMNLLVNASQAIEKQGEIRVKTWHDGTSIYASVSDTGCGIPESVRTRIFEPFFTTKEVGKGTGLGLSITYDIIKKHNGDIYVESEPGNGTTLTIRLPIT
jgi:two-component system, NtrC family, sensor kinase